ncbi:VOC family protein [Paraburkholderia xenovorans]
MKSPLKATFKHVGIYVVNLERMADFYQRWFGLVATDGGMGGAGKGVFLSSDPTEHHQIVLVAGRDPASKPTVNQLSFLVDNLTALKAYYKKAQTEDVAISMIKSHGNALKPLRDRPGRQPVRDLLQYAMVHQAARRQSHGFDPAGRRHPRAS